MINIERVRSELLAIGIRFVAFEYSGYGDEGGISSLPMFNLLPPLPPEGWPDHLQYETDDSAKPTPLELQLAANVRFDALKQPKYEDILLEQAEDILYNQYAVDWINDDGGYGIVYIDLLAKNWYVDGYVKVTHDEPESATGTFLQWDTSNLVSEIQMTLLNSGNG